MAAPETQEKREFHVDFGISSSRISLRRSENRQQLMQLDSLLRSYEDGKLQMIDSIVVEGWSSPDGPVRQNLALARRRRNAMRRYISSRHPAIASKIVDGRAGIAWESLMQAVENSEEAWRDTVLAILRDTPMPGRRDTRNARLKRLDGGRLWPELVREYYAPLRSSSSAVFTIYASDIASAADTAQAAPQESIYEAIAQEMPDTISALAEIQPEIIETAETIVEESLPAEAPQQTPALPLWTERPRYTALYTNLLYDALTVLNIGAEIGIGRNCSLAANWQYGWWEILPKDYHWRSYGGYIAARHWFGRMNPQALQGHHIGIYGQMLQYDYAWKGHGHASGDSEQFIFRHPTWGVGLEYGYSMPIAHRLFLDFNIGIGYYTGRYSDYDYRDSHYVWQKTKNLRYFGPAKIEVSLVWLLNEGATKKGGAL